MLKEKRSQRIVILICGLSILIGLSTYIFLRTGRGNDIRPDRGVLSLKDWNPQQDGRITLSGQWEFRWQDFVTYGQSDTSGITVKVPSVWSDYEGTGNSGFGFGTYILKVENVQAGVPLALRIPNLSSSYELYIDSRLCSKSGKISTTKEGFIPWQKSDIVEFTPEKNSFSILIRVANYAFAQGGMRYAISMGTPEQIREMDKSVADTDLFLFGALTVMAFYYFLIFLLRPEDKKPVEAKLLLLAFL